MEQRKKAKPPIKKAKPVKSCQKPAKSPPPETHANTRLQGKLKDGENLKASEKRTGRGGQPDSFTRTPTPNSPQPSKPPPLKPLPSTELHPTPPTPKAQLPYGFPLVAPFWDDQKTHKASQNTQGPPNRPSWASGPPELPMLALRGPSGRGGACGLTARRRKLTVTETTRAPFGRRRRGYEKGTGALRCESQEVGVWARTVRFDWLPKAFWLTREIETGETQASTPPNDGFSCFLGRSRA